MDRPLNRTFSFEDNDEQALSSDQQERLAYHTSRPYRDSPSRDLQISPPPSYTSPPPHEPVSPPSPTPRFHPGAHPDSSYARLSGQRFSSVADSHRRDLPLPTDSSSADAPPPPPVHRRIPSTQASDDGRLWAQELGYAPSLRTGSTTTPGMDNLGTAAAGGGIAGIAMGVANTNERESGVEALRAVEVAGGEPYRGPVERGFDVLGSDTPYIPSRPEPSRQLRTQDSNSSDPFRTPAPSAGHLTPGQTTPRLNPSNYSGHSIPLSEYPSALETPYQDSPYQSRSGYATRLNDGPFNPAEIADDGDDGFIPDPKRRSVLNLGRQTSRGEILPAAGGGAVAGAAGGGVAGKIGGLFGRNAKGPSASGSYGPVGQETAYTGAADGGEAARGGEKSEWLSRQTKGNNKMRWVVGLAIGAVVILAIIGGIVGGVLGSKNSKSSNSASPAWNSTNNAQTDEAANGDLNKDSAEIKALMNNPNLHKVFPGMDYTPWGTQYPLCLTYPPSQNNVTRDMAVLSQLTNAVRLYGTDCNQTEMVLHAISQLGLTDMKVWLGVWIETNVTTNDRQIAQMYKILEETEDLSIFKGAIIGNEALYRAGLDKASSQADLINTLTEVKSNFTSKKYDIPVATSDLGDNWNPQLAAAVDIVMSNIHPFFAGVTPEVAPGWTWDFWTQHDTILTQGTSKQNIIAETGWPSAGGNDCGSDTVACPDATAGSIAGVDEMNTYLDGFVCQSLANGTEFFWFEAFDEPWKVIYNTPGRDWEDKWGLMDPARNLKPGLKIPDCGGTTAT